MTEAPPPPPAPPQRFIVVAQGHDGVQEWSNTIAWRAEAGCLYFQQENGIHRMLAISRFRTIAIHPQKH